VASRIDAEFEDCGFSFWAVEVSGVPRSSALWFASGAVHSAITPAVEVGWRLARNTGSRVRDRGGKRGRSFGLEDVGLDEVVSFTTPDNVRSWR